ncbi:pro-neuropeptide Y-like [Eriocheir sinensis]|uniref:pro-neuropeptide Y-like n=1 Tax=Eriocheir sinensis TaxID=95602 RepID=UPI0021CAC601|nr:pro-neuropeptide Y-like [Eriocheir sinensis]
MRGSVMVVAVVATVAVAWAAQLPGRQDGQPIEALQQALHDAALSGSLGSGEVQYPAGRPNIFKTPRELRQYLDALNAYFAIAGRPRFGKRGDHMRPAEELYDY